MIHKISKFMLLIDKYTSDDSNNKKYPYSFILDPENIIC